MIFSIRAKTDSALVLDQFTDRTDASVAQVVDIVDMGILVAEFQPDQIFKRLDHIFFA